MISFCIITKDEEEKLKKCIAAIRKYAPGYEIVVVDTGSKDESILSASTLGANVYSFSWIDDFSAARNFAAEKAVGNIIIMIDSDEEIFDINMPEIEKHFRENPLLVGHIAIHNEISQAEGDSVSVDWVSRCYDKSYYKYCGAVHEQITPLNMSLVTGGDNTFRLPFHVLHTGYALDEEGKSQKADRNIRLLFSELEREEKAANRAYIYYQLGKSHYFKGDYESAADLFSKTLSYDLDEHLEYVTDCVVSYGYALLNAGRIEEALDLSGVYDTFKDDADYMFVLGLIYMKNAMFDEAVMSFSEATGLKKHKVEGVNSFKAFYNMGVIKECLGDFQKASEYYSKCGAYEPAAVRLKELG